MCSLCKIRKKYYLQHLWDSVEVWKSLRAGWGLGKILLTEKLLPLEHLLWKLFFKLLKNILNFDSRAPEPYEVKCDQVWELPVFWVLVYRAKYQTFVWRTHPTTLASQSPFQRVDAFFRFEFVSIHWNILLLKNYIFLHRIPYWAWPLYEGPLYEWPTERTS